MSEQEQRVLSVSYGSFSVKLEGFDDPFAIMRRVTEYFRSVASLDPSFGLKPLNEDLAVFEALETAVFDDDISIETEGSTLTLSPRDQVENQPAEQYEPAERDVFVLDEGAMTQEPVIQAPLQTEVATLPEDSSIQESAEQQTAAAATPLDLSDMARDHLEMPFIGAKATKPHSASSAAVAPQADVQAVAEDVQAPAPEPEVAVMEEAIPEAPMIDFDVEPLQEDVQEPQVPELAEPQTLELPEPVEAADPQEVAPEPKSVPKFRTLTLSDFEEPKADEAPEQEQVADVAEAEAEVAQAQDAAQSLENQTPVEKRPLRIIRSNYSYEEPEDLAPAAKATPEPKTAVNPFRKFPKRETAPAPQEMPKIEVPQAQEDIHDDLIRAYRKIKAEHG